MTLIKLDDSEVSGSSSSTLIPRLLSFPGGVPKSLNDKDNDDKSSNSNYELIIGKKKKKRLIIANDTNLDVTYHGSDYSSSSHKKNACKYAIGIYDKDKDVLILQEADHAFVMRPLFTFDGKDGTMEETSHLTSSEIQGWQRKHGLIEAFGTVKKRKAVKAQKSQRIDGENIEGGDNVGESLNKNVKELFFSDEDDKTSLFNEQFLDGQSTALMEHRKEILPQFNLNVIDNKVKNAYPIEHIIPKNIELELKSYYETITKNISIEEYYNNKFKNSKLISMILNQYMNENKIKKINIKLLLLLHMMLLYIELKTKQHKELSIENFEKNIFGNDDYALSKAVSKFILIKFWKLRTINKKMKMEKLLFYILILALHLTKFKLPLEPMVEDLKVPAVHIKKVARETGCKLLYEKIDDKKTNTIAELIVPLTFPTISRGVAK